MMKLISDESRGLFPIATTKDFVTFVENEFFKKLQADNEDLALQQEPNLALLSIVLGRIEKSLTTTSQAAGTFSKKSKIQRHARTLVQANIPEAYNGIEPEGVADNVKNDGSHENEFPPLEYELVLALYDNFKAKLLSSLNTDLILHDKNSPLGTSRELITSISDLFWNSLSRNCLLDKPHFQTLYSFVTGYKLDSFGLSLAVVASAQILGLQDVHLVLSEDHSWVTFGRGEQANSTAEVTWHGRTGEDKRGRPVEDSPSWLYQKGWAITCTRWMEMAAIVSAINPSISILSYSREMSSIQCQLLQKLHDLKLLERFPMAIGHLADLKEMSEPTVEPIKSCTDLFEEAISISRIHYNNMHIYPHLYYAGYLYRHEDFKGALRCWAEAAQIVSRYRYSKLDEDIYKEFIEISKEHLTSMMRKCSAGFSANSPTRDPECYASLLRYFDGICFWEEQGTIPVLHITWAQCWMNSLTKFEWTARKGVKIFGENGDPESNGGTSTVCDTDTSQPTNGQSTSGFTDMNGNSKGPGSDALVDEDGNRIVCVYFRSSKMKKVTALLQKEKIIPANIILEITAQQTFGWNSTESNENGSHKVGGRSSRGVKNKSSLDELPTDTETGTKRRRRT